MSGGPTSSVPKSIPPFVLGFAWATRICSSSCGNVAGNSIESQVAIVSLVEPPSMGGSDSSFIPFESDGRSKLLNLVLQG